MNIIRKVLLYTVALLTLTSTSSFAFIENTLYITVSGGGFKASKWEKKIMQMLTRHDEVSSTESKIGFIGFIGAGYEFNEHIRMDATFFFTNPRYENCKMERKPGETPTNEPNLKKEEWDWEIKQKAYGAMLSGYASFPLSDFIEVYIGPSLGYSYITTYGGTTVTSIFKDSNNPNLEYSKKHYHDDSNPLCAINLLWGINAGISFNTEKFYKIDVQYRYLNLGGIYNSIIKEYQSHYPTVKGHVVTVGFRKEF